MTRCVLVGVLYLAFLVTATGAGREPDKKPDAKSLPPQIIKLAPQSEKKPVSSLAYRLLPNPLDQVDGNAALLWYRAVLAARAVRHKWTDKEWDWNQPSKTALDKFPRKEVKAILDKHARALQLADQAALRKRCDWELPDITLQNLDDLPLEEIQGMRPACSAAHPPLPACFE